LCRALVRLYRSLVLTFKYFYATSLGSEIISQDRRGEVFHPKKRYTWTVREKVGGGWLVEFNVGIKNTCSWWAADSGIGLRRN
jgi:hypothetical protein